MEIVLNKDRLRCLVQELSQVLELPDLDSVVLRITEERVYIQPAVKPIQIVIKNRGRAQ